MSPEMGGCTAGYGKGDITELGFMCEAAKKKTLFLVSAASSSLQAAYPTHHAAHQILAFLSILSLQSNFIPSAVLLISRLQIMLL